MISLADILPAALNSLDITSEPCPLEIPKAKRVVIFLVDGLGFRNLADHSSLHLVANQILKTNGKSTLPSTTPVALASIGTGLAPGAHGFLGATMYVEEIKTVLQPLKWQSDPNPKGIQPLTTKFEVAESKYIEVNRIGPAAYANSGLTQAVLRGGSYLPAENLDEIVQVVAKCLKLQMPSLTYVYYRELDRVGHVQGVDSEDWRKELIAVLETIGRIQKLLTKNDQLLITADHGMIDIENRIWLEDIPKIWNKTKILTGEPRFRHFYATKGNMKALGQALGVLEPFATIYERDEFISSGLVGEVDEYFYSRIGDFVAIARDKSAICSRSVDRRSSNLIGNHGGNTDTERDIPVSVMAG